MTASGGIEEVGNVPGKRGHPMGELYGGQRGGLKAMVLRQAKEYLEAYKGQDDTGEDGGLHGLLLNIIEGKETGDYRARACAPCFTIPHDAHAHR